VLEAASLLDARGGDGGDGSSTDGGAGGGGRIAVFANSLTRSGSSQSYGPGGLGVAGTDGSLFIDEAGGVLSVQGNGFAANEHAAYTSLLVEAGCTLAPGGTGTVVSVTVSNAAVAVVAGTLMMDIDGTGPGSADKLTVTNGLTITGATLDLNEIVSADDSLYVLAEYDSLTGVFGSIVDMPAGYALDYAYGSNQIALVGIPEIDVPAVVDFGLVPEGATSNLTVSISNRGAGLLTISGVSTQGTDAALFSVTTPFPTIVDPWMTSNIVVQYAPGAVGTHSATLWVTSDDSDDPSVSIGLQGVGIETNANIGVPMALSFVPTLPSTTNSLNVPVANEGASNLTLSVVSLSSTDADQFTVVGYPVTVVSLTVSNIVVEYHPDALGTHTANLDIVSNDPDESPTNVVLTGLCRVSAATGSRFDPIDHDSFGTLSITSGVTLVFNTATLDVSTNGSSIGTGVVVTSENTNVELALFNFETVDIGTNVMIAVPKGDPKRGLVLGAKRSITIGSNIDISGQDGILNSGTIRAGPAGTEAGTLFIDEEGGVLSVAGNGLAANSHTTSYGSLWVSAPSTFTPGGIGTAGTASIDGDATIAGTLTIDAGGRQSDFLDVTGTLAISGATLDVRAYAPVNEGATIVIAEYDTRVGTFGTVTLNGLADYEIDYAYKGNRIALVSTGSFGMLLMVR